MKKSVLFLGVLVFVSSAFGEWIAYPLDSDIALYEEFCARRIARGSVEPICWKGSRAASNARFMKRAVTDRPTTITVKLDGKGFGLLNHREKFYFPDGLGVFEIPAGTNTVEFRIFNCERVPSLCVAGGVWTTDGSWQANDGTKCWIPAETRGGDITLDAPPTRVSMTTQKRQAVRFEREEGGVFVDFGRESFGYVVLESVLRGGKVRAVYGESDAEAHGGDAADSWEVVDVRPAEDGTFRFPVARAMKAVRLESWKGSDVAFASAHLDEELPPDVSRAACFTSSDPRLDAIWRLSARTLDLCSREFLVDGIKRDRWCWSFDTYLAARYNYYLHADAAIVRRTLTALRGREDVKTPIGNILENSFYWFMELGEYVLYTGDCDFARQIYPRARSLMDYCLKNRDANGFADYRAGQWIFIDWVAGNLHNDGAVAVVQQLLVSALESFSRIADMLGEKADAALYRTEAVRLRAKIKPTYWDESRGALRHCMYPDGSFDAQFTPHANLRGIIDGYFTPEERQRVVDAVFVRAEAVPIRTPAWRGIELEALFALGKGREALARMNGFWGVMLDRGATSVWEEFDPAETEAETQAMYGRRFGRSLCHGWGASPVYLIGRYVLGVRPTAPGFAEYEVAPNPSGLASFEGTVETPLGPITVKYDGKDIEVIGNRGCGTLIWNGQKKEINRVVDEYDNVIHPGNPDGTDFWNGRSIWFMYAPAFGFKRVDGAASYRFTVKDAKGVSHAFTAAEPTASLAPVWRHVSIGDVTVVCEGLDASGAVLGKSGERTFIKVVGFRKGAYPPPVKDFRTAALGVYEYAFRSKSLQYLLETGCLDMSDPINSYASKACAGFISAMVRYAEIAPENRDRALMIARKAAEYLIARAEKGDAPLAWFPQTYDGPGEAGKGLANKGLIMLLYPAQAASAILQLYEATGETRWLDYAEKIAATFLKLQGEDGTWSLKMRASDGQPVNVNRLVPIRSILPMFETLYRLTKKSAYRRASDRAFAYVERTCLADWNWEGQFEDIVPSGKYVNLTKHDAVSTAILILERFPDDPARRRQARELMRFAEDQFVCWKEPIDGGAVRHFTTWRPTNRYDQWVTPCALEQYECYWPIDASAVKMIRGYLAIYRVERNPIDLEKARTLGATMTRLQKPNGRIPTWWWKADGGGQDWMNCMFASAQALLQLAEFDRQ